MRVGTETVFANGLERNLLPRRVRFEPTYAGHATRPSPELGLLAVVAIEGRHGTTRIVIADVSAQVCEWDILLHEQKQLIRQLAL